LRAEEGDESIDELADEAAKTKKVLNPVVAGAVPVGAGGGTVVPPRSILRACDFNQIPGVAAQNSAATSAIIRVTGGTVSAEVHLAEPGAPGAH